MLLFIILASLMLFFVMLKLFDISVAIIENIAAALLAVGYLLGKKLVK